MPGRGSISPRWKLMSTATSRSALKKPFMSSRSWKKQGSGDVGDGHWFINFIIDQQYFMALAILIQSTNKTSIPIFVSAYHICDKAKFKKLIP